MDPAVRAGLSPASPYGTVTPSAFRASQSIRIHEMDYEQIGAIACGKRIQNDVIVC